jgi:hypothetical protein
MNRCQTLIAHSTCAATTGDLRALLRRYESRTESYLCSTGGMDHFYDLSMSRFNTVMSLKPPNPSQPIPLKVLEVSAEMCGLV